MIYFNNAYFDINIETIRFNRRQMLQMISTITKTVYYQQLPKFNEAPNTRQQSSYLPTMSKANKQLINLFQQYCLKIERCFS